MAKFSACMIPADMSTTDKLVMYSPSIMLLKSKRGFISNYRDIKPNLSLSG